MARGRRPDETAYQHLLDIAQATVQQAEQVRAVLHAQATHGLTGDNLGPRRAVGLSGNRADDPTDVAGEAVPASEKVVSLFEPHTAIIRKGKPGKPTEFGRVLWLDEVEGGIISRYAVLEGNPPEDAQLPPSLDHHRRVFHVRPACSPGNAGSTHRERAECYDAGRQAGRLPKPGATSAKRLAHEQ